MQVTCIVLSFGFNLLTSLTDAPAMPKPTNKFRSPCAVSSSLELFGDKWSLIIIRDMFLGKKTYTEFLQSSEKIPTNILAARLKKMLQDGLIYKQPYKDKPPRYAYHLTSKGLDLSHILLEITRWGLKYIDNSYAPAEVKKRLEQ